MDFRGLIASHNERKAARTVRADSQIFAEQIASKLIDRSATRFRFNPGSPPKGVSAGEFRDRIGIETVDELGRIGVVSHISYDPEASKQATSEFEAIDPSQPLPPDNNEVRVVFVRA